MCIPLSRDVSNVFYSFIQCGKGDKTRNIGINYIDIVDPYNSSDRGNCRNKIKLKTRGRRSCWLSTLDHNKRDLIS